MSTPPRPRLSAVLLLGPTGSGKTPLGEVIEARGLWGARFVHFDFGAAMRRLVQRDLPDEIVTRADLDFLREVLGSGALLEDDQFPLAERVLRSFLAARDEMTTALPPTVLLNGLPRHAGQAEAVSRLLEVRAVVRLACSPETVLERIRTNAGGDRAGRADDGLASVRNKLAIYAERTAPLEEYYQARGVPIHTLEVTPAMTPQEAWQRLERGGGRV